MKTKRFEARVAISEGGPCPLGAGPSALERVLLELAALALEEGGGAALIEADRFDRWEGDGEAYLEARLAGVGLPDLDLSVSGGLVMIRVAARPEGEAPPRGRRRARGGAGVHATT